MARNAQETVDLMRRPVTRSITRKIEEEDKGMVALFRKNIQDLAWNSLEGEDKDQKTPKYS